MPPDLSKNEVKEVTEEGNLLIEAVSLLVQRQRETEGWVAEQIWQAEERAAVAERRYADLEVRLAGIEEHLSQLVQEVEPARGDAVVDERLSRLREQVEGLKTVGTDGRPATSARVGGAPEVAAVARETEAATSAPRHAPEPAAEPRRAPEPPRYAPPPVEPRYATPPAATAPGPAGAATTSAGAGLMELLGPTPEDRWGIVLIGLGAIAVLYVLLTSLRFG